MLGARAQAPVRRGRESRAAPVRRGDRSPCAIRPADPPRRHQRPLRSRAAWRGGPAASMAVRARFPAASGRDRLGGHPPCSAGGAGHELPPSHLDLPGARDLLCRPGHPTVPEPRGEHGDRPPGPCRRAAEDAALAPRGTLGPGAQRRDRRPAPADPRGPFAARRGASARKPHASATTTEVLALPPERRRPSRSMSDAPCAIASARRCGGKASTAPIRASTARLPPVRPRARAAAMRTFSSGSERRSLSQATDSASRSAPHSLAAATRVAVSGLASESRSSPPRPPRLITLVTCHCWASVMPGRCMTDAITGATTSTCVSRSLALALSTVFWPVSAETRAWLICAAICCESVAPSLGSEAGAIPLPGSEVEFWGNVGTLSAICAPARFARATGRGRKEHPKR